METIKYQPEMQKEDISKRVTENSKKLDAEIRQNPRYSEEEIKKSWKEEEWQIGDMTIKAIGVCHVPETFLEFRTQIEEAIKESDLVVNEFSPEALGFYDRPQTDKLKGIESRFNKDYNLEQLRQTYIQHERESGAGIFHHEVELLAAKYGKDLACVDPTGAESPEQALQSFYIYQKWAEQGAEERKFLEQLGLLGVAAALGAAGAETKINKSMTRRSFLKKAALFGAAATVAAVTPKITKVSLTPKEKLYSNDSAMDKNEDSLQNLRNPWIAESLRRLSQMGYKKVAFIYGVGHLKWIKKFLDDQWLCEEVLRESEGLIDKNKLNSYAFQIFHLSPGQNNSEKFVASEKMVWKRLEEN
ncbi:MAG: twin-arginine translocation signal domain-containing protein [Candidatus Pacebacteria bacterium]|nr:twin-arginine translocation signal domain-containing protein [Candidatus Paceibacterota bacterium]